MRRHLKGGPFGFAQGQAESEPSSTETEPASGEFKFDYRPKDVKAYLDRFVIKQEEAKRVLSVALCDHYHHVRQALDGKTSSNYAQ